MQAKTKQEKQENDTKIEKENLESQSLTEVEQVKLVNNFILRVYKQILEKQSEVFDQNFSFFYFILVSQENDCIPYRAVLNLKKDFQSKFTLKQMQKIDTILRAIDKKIEFKSLLVKKKSTLQLFSILDFDNSINKIVQDYTLCLRLYKDAVTQLAQSFIDLNVSYSYLDTFRKDRNSLALTIKETIRKNTHSEQLRNICLNFDYYLNQNAFLSMYFEKMQRETQSTAQLMKEYYNPYTCFAFVSLLKKTQGTILRVSRTFTKVFSLSSKQMAMNQNLTVFINSCFNLQSQSGGISAYHFIQHNFNNYNEISNIPLIIGRDSFGFAIPLQVQIQSQKLEDLDFGFTLWIKPLIEQKIYILLDQKIKGKVSCISRSLKDYLLPEEFNVNHTSRLRADNMMPILKGYLGKKKDYKIKLDTLFIKPSITSKGSSMLNDLDTENPNYLMSLLSKELFFVTLTFQKQSNKLIKFSFVEIESFYALQTIEERVSAVFALQTQLKELCDIQLDFDPTSHYSYYDVKQTIEVKKIVEEGLLKIDSNEDRDLSFIDSKMDVKMQQSSKRNQQPYTEKLSQFSFDNKVKTGDMKQVKDLDKQNKLNSSILKTDEEEMQKEMRKHYTMAHRESKTQDKETTQDADYNQSMYVPGLDSLQMSNTNLMTDKNNLRTFFTNLKKTNIRMNDKDMQVIATNDESKFNTQGEIRRQRKNEQKQSITSSKKSVTDTQIQYFPLFYSEIIRNILLINLSFLNYNQTSSTNKLTNQLTN